MIIDDKKYIDIPKRLANCERWEKKFEKDNLAIRAIISALQEDVEYLKNEKEKENGNVRGNVFEWIPCSERLPEKSGEYLVTINYETIQLVQRRVVSFNANCKKWLMLKSNTIKVMAWAELPEVYESE